MLLEAKGGDISSIKNLLLEPSGVTSLYLVEDDTALRRVAVGLNSTREGTYERTLLLPILQRSLEKASLSPDKTPGDTECVFANEVHFDLALTSSDAEALWECLTDDGLAEVRFSKGKMKQAMRAATDEGCFAGLRDSVKCDCGATRDRVGRRLH